MKPVKTSKFRKFLKSLGLEHKRDKGDHEIWDKMEPPDLLRPVVFRGNYKEIPGIHVHTNLTTLSISLDIPLKELKKKLKNT